MPSTKAPSTISEARVHGLVIAAHGSNRRPEANAYVQELADEITRRNVFAWVTTVFAVDDKEFSLPDGEARGVVIIPFFMSDGGLAEKLTAEIAGSLSDQAPNLQILQTDPIGSRAEITDYAIDLATSASQQTPHSAEESALVLVAHGSSVRPESREDARKQVNAIKAHRRFDEVKLALLEEPPSLGDILHETSKPTVVVGLFAAPGGHAMDDVAAEIDAAGIEGVCNAGPVGLHAGFGELITAVALETIANYRP